MKKDFIFIGPMGAGKSTLAKLVSEHLNRPLCKLDRLRKDYYPIFGGDIEKLKSLESDSFHAFYKACKPLEFKMVFHALKEHEGSVFDFGAGHAVYEEQIKTEAINKLLGDYPNIFLILPSPDIKESMFELNRRRTQIIDIEYLEVNRQIISQLCKAEFPHHVIYTKGKTPEECAQTVLKLSNI